VFTDSLSFNENKFSKEFSVSVSKTLSQKKSAFALRKSFSTNLLANLFFSIEASSLKKKLFSALSSLHFFFGKS
jgi:hypothetical protein